MHNEYLLKENGVCQKCYLPYCEKCHYNKSNNIECDKCEKGYYKNSIGYCVKCREIAIKNGMCEICSENNSSEYKACSCDYRFAYAGNSKCIECPKNCSECKFNSELNKP